jgi:hypothetical protein
MLIAFTITTTQLALAYALIYGRFGLPPLGLVGAAVAALLAAHRRNSLSRTFLLFRRHCPLPRDPLAYFGRRTSAAVPDRPRSRYPHRRIAAFADFRHQYRGAYGRCDPVRL